MLPEQAVRCQKPQSESTSQAVSFVLTGDMDFAIQYQVEPVFTRML